MRELAEPNSIPDTLTDLSRKRGLFDPNPTYARLRENTTLPQVHTPAGIPVWLVTRYQDARAVLADIESFSSRNATTAHLVAGIPIDLPAAPGAVVRLDGSAHLRIRFRLAAELTVKRISRMRPRIERIVATCVDRLQAAGPPADLHQHVALAVAGEVLGELLGIPPSDRARLGEAVTTMLDLRTTPENREQAQRRLGGYLESLVGRKLNCPGTDLLSRLINNPDKPPLSARELVGIAGVLITGGRHTTANLITLAVLRLLHEPAQAERIRRDPDVLRTGVDELVRYLNVVHNGVLRTAVRDTVLSGRQIRRGEHVAVVLESANRDPKFLHDADVLDLERRSAHVGFGFGSHQCLGQHLARLQVQVVLPELLRRFRNLRITAPASSLVASDQIMYSVERLPVTWDSATNRGETTAFIKSRED